MRGLPWIQGCDGTTLHPTRVLGSLDNPGGKKILTNQ